jgi:hypothetical protein
VGGATANVAAGFDAAIFGIAGRSGGFVTRTVAATLGGLRVTGLAFGRLDLAGRVARTATTAGEPGIDSTAAPACAATNASKLIRAAMAKITERCRRDHM